MKLYKNCKKQRNIFGKNLYQDESLLPMFKDVLGFGEMKPFECVGTFEESQAALYMARDKFKDDVVAKHFLPHIENGEELVKEVFKTAVSKVPARFKFLGMKNVFILGNY